MHTNQFVMLNNGDIIGNRFVLLQPLGRGAYAETWKAKDVSCDSVVALKLMSVSNIKECDREDIVMQRVISKMRSFWPLAKLCHCNISNIITLDFSFPYFFITIPYYEKGSVAKLLREGPISEKLSWRILRDVAAGLAYLHKQTPPIIHQDIKLENILIKEDDTFILADVGLDQLFGEIFTTLTSDVNDNHMGQQSPIFYTGTVSYSRDSRSIMSYDIWSLGKVMYELMIGSQPFGDYEQFIQMEGDELPKIEGNYSPRLKAIVYKCLSANPWERPRAEDLG